MTEPIDTESRDRFFPAFPPRSEEEGKNIRADIKDKVKLAESGVVIRNNNLSEPDPKLVERAFRKMREKAEKEIKTEVPERGKTVR